ncbi:hypothetical protein KC333_g204 [Hortaea werneckii]|nr:hypothetical protein KC333_g204 [Hortaea werneckii]
MLAFCCAEPLQGQRSRGCDETGAPTARCPWRGLHFLPDQAPCAARASASQPRPCVHQWSARGSFLKLHSLELLQQLQVLVSELTIELRKGLIFRSPSVDLLLQGANLIISASLLLLEVSIELIELSF